MLKDKKSKRQTRDRLIEISKDLFNTTTEKDTLRTFKGQLVYKGQFVSDSQREELIKQARTLLEMNVWTLMMDEIRYLGSKKIFLEGQNSDDLLFGRAVLWVQDIVEKKVRNLAALKDKSALKE